MVYISFEIKSRGTIVIRYGNRSITLTGELVFEPATFYVDLNSFGKWDPPFEDEMISYTEKDKIISYLSKQIDSKTKIIFD